MDLEMLQLPPTGIDNDEIDMPGDEEPDEDWLLKEMEKYKAENPQHDQGMEKPRQNNEPMQQFEPPRKVAKTFDPNVNSLR